VADKVDELPAVYGVSGKHEMRTEDNVAYDVRDMARLTGKNGRASELSPSTNGLRRQRRRVLLACKVASMRKGNDKGDAEDDDSQVRRQEKMDGFNEHGGFL
jgi:hypothetical protein